MAPTNGYATTAELKAWLSITNSTDDTLIDNAITAASRQIDGYTHRRYYAATETRHFTPVVGNSLLVDDLISVTTLKQDNDESILFSEYALQKRAELQRSNFYAEVEHGSHG